MSEKATAGAAGESDRALLRLILRQVAEMHRHLLLLVKALDRHMPGIVAEVMGGMGEEP